jgi:hypothetical protein
MYVCTHADTPVCAAKYNGSGSDLILNDCLAYLRFGRYWPFATNFSLGPDVRFRDEAEVGRAAEFTVSVENDPGCSLIPDLWSSFMNILAGPGFSPR